MQGNGTYSFHPICELFPEPSEAELKSLADDIKQHGQQIPIMVFDGKIYDGRSRYKACQLAGVDPKIKTSTKEPSLSAVVSLNINRRHMSASQIAAVMTELLPLFEAEAKKRQAATRKQNLKRQPGVTKEKPLKDSVSSVRGKITPNGAIPTDADIALASIPGKSVEHAAAIGGISDRTLKDAKIVKDNNPELFEQIKAGDISASAAAKQVKDEKREEEPPKWKPKKDKYGTPIPKSLEESFASDEQFKQALDLHLPACGKAILELGRAKILKSQVVEVCRNSLAMVATKLKQARPYRVCKDCEGAGCKKCGQHGYFTQPTN